MTRFLKVGLFGLALALTASPANAGEWSSTPSPNKAAGGTLYCYLGYADPARTAMVLLSNGHAGDYRLLIEDPAFERASNGGKGSKP